jgi:hypothetical protein
MTANYHFTHDRNGGTVMTPFPQPPDDRDFTLLNLAACLSILLLICLLIPR